jgi:hypothetical protein
MLQSIKLNLKMILLNKNCAVCVYNGPCEDRKDRVDIKDCCIPEKPLRELQKTARTVERFIQVTHDYIYLEKQNSHYWRKTLKTQ